VFPPLANLFAKSEMTVFRKAKSLLYSLSLEPAMGFYITNAQIEDRLWQRLATSGTRQQLAGYHPAQLTLDAYNKADGPDHLAKILYTDLKTYLPGGILVKVDRMSMANSLEVRAPLLDKDIVEFAATLPSNMKFKNGEKKHILKEAFKPLLPDGILHRKKMGFSVPLESWFRHEIKDLAYDYLFTKSQGIQQFFDMQVVQDLWQQHQSQRADHATVLWSMLMFQMWWFRYMQTGSEGEQAQ
jgi:asparagine synthase (glutamine-hydrolysing)